MLRYRIQLTRDDNDTFLVDVPDVPEAHTFGETQEEAKTHAVDAILTIFDAYIKDKRDIPAPSPIRRGQISIEIPPLDVAKIGLYNAMRDAGIGKYQLAKTLGWHLPQLDRVLRLRYRSRFDQVQQALEAVGKRVVISVEDRNTATDTQVATVAGKVRRTRRKALAATG